MRKYLYNIKKLIPSFLLTQKLPMDARNSVLLTFDDGPDANITPAVLEKLRAYNAKAVFFLVGKRIQNAPHVIEMLRKEGHILGNHSDEHFNKEQPWCIRYMRDLMRCQNRILDITGEKPKYFRPPHGTISLTTLFAPRILGLHTMTWSVDVGDWRCRTKEDAIEASDRLIQLIRPRDIVVLHDDHPGIIEILDRVLPYLKQFDLSSGVEHLV